jgi:hypothetical protein
VLNDASQPTGTSIVHCTFDGSVERIRQASQFLPGGVSSNFRLDLPTPLVRPPMDRFTTSMGIA